MMVAMADEMDGRVRGCLFGLAYGDAMGLPTEFARYESIVAEHGAAGPTELPVPARVTDDTQMTLAVGDALLGALEVPPPLTAERLEPRLRGRYLAWLVDPENTRAPGQTCITACRRMAKGQTWLAATEPGSKGCGANMRVAPVGLVAGIGDDELAGAAQLQAALTHGHPTGLAASELTAYAVLLLRTGTAPADLLAALRDRCAGQRTVYREDWLDTLWRRSGDADPVAFISRGWDECDAALATVERSLGPEYPGDPCALTGAGWIAEEALATALYCFLATPDDPVRVIGRGAATSGDSDSIACLAGAFAGAHLGMAAWPPEWSGRIEYAAELDRLSVGFSS